MNIDELQSVKSQERQSDTLQQLRASFYEEAGEYIQQLREQRDHAAEAADDPFSSPEVQRLTDEIETAERIVEDIYDRRVGKLVKMASFAAADMPTDDEGLTKREEALFERLVEAIEGNREQILAVLDGEDPDVPTGSAPEPPTDAGTAEESEPAAAPDPEVGAADLMGDPAEAAPDETPPSPSEGDERPAPSDMEADGGTATAEASQQAPPEPTAAPEPPAEPDTDTVADVDAEEETEEVEAESSADPAPTDSAWERTTLRITRDVGEIMGVDERSYDLASEDVVTLPAENAEPLLRKDAAERLD